MTTLSSDLTLRDDLQIQPQMEWSPNGIIPYPDMPLYPRGDLAEGLRKDMMGCNMVLRWPPNWGPHDPIWVDSRPSRTQSHDPISRPSSGTPSGGPKWLDDITLLRPSGYPSSPY